MINIHHRVEREQTTVATMIGIYCHGQHGTGNGLCPDCRDLQDYAWHRLEKCPFQAGKTTCAQCPIHCYRPEMREKIKRVMRYAGPRMLFRHPVLALFHLVDGLRKEPIRPLPYKASLGRREISRKVVSDGKQRQLERD